MKMKDFDESLMKTCRILQDITPFQSDCLNALVSSEPLIAWLKESMKKGAAINAFTNGQVNEMDLAQKL